MSSRDIPEIVRRDIGGALEQVNRELASLGLSAWYDETPLVPGAAAASEHGGRPEQQEHADDEQDDPGERPHEDPEQDAEHDEQDR